MPVFWPVARGGWLEATKPIDLAENPQVTSVKEGIALHSELGLGGTVSLVGSVVPVRKR